jgi:hypothetical protein
VVARSEENLLAQGYGAIADPVGMVRRQSRMNRLLDEFGSELIVRARDDAIGAIDRLLAGLDPSDRGRALAQRLGELTPEKVETHRAVAVEAVDVALHHVLSGFEQSSKFDVVAQGEGEVISLRESSDGLSGELYSEDGWFARFSRYGERP